MLFLVVILSLLLILSIRHRAQSEDILNRETTDTLKGLAIIVVFVDHIRGYLSNTSLPLWGDEQLLTLFGFITKYMVSLFLFYSGYGVTLSIIQKGEGYVKSMPQRRILPTLFNFDVAVVLFLLVDIILGISYPSKTICLSFLAWESIGNSNWYIFAILCCYLCSYIGSRFSNKRINSIVITALLIFFYLIIVSCLKEPWWSNVILAYLGGVFYTIYKDKITELLQKRFLLIAIISAIGFIICFRKSQNIFLCNVSALFFISLTLLICNKFTFKSILLLWFGKNLFLIYIYQRIPMIILSIVWPNLVQDNPYIFFVICFVVTCIIAKLMFQYKYKGKL